MAEDRVANVRQQAVADFVPMRTDYMEWREAIQECCKTSSLSGWDDPLPTLNDVQNRVDISLDSGINSSNVRLNE